MYHKCDKDVVECECDDSLERLKWLLSPKSPVLILGEYRNTMIRRVQELEGLKELKELHTHEDNPA